MIIYKATNKVNGKVYIGQTIHTLEHRKFQHEREASCARRRTVYFHMALKKYGFHNFAWEELEKCCSKEELDDKERYYIDFYRSTNRKLGYNLKLGGRSGGVCNAEAKRHMGESTKKKWQNPETAAKMLAGLRKGTDTVKAKAKNFFEVRVCPICKKVFKRKPSEKATYCSRECLLIGNRTASVRNAQKGTQVTKAKYQSLLPEKIAKIYDWVRENQPALKNVQFNNLKFLHGLATYLDVKDVRTVAKMLGVNYRKELARKLIEINENIC